MNNAEQAEQLLATFFPPLPDNIEDEGDRPQRQPVPMPELTVEEIEACLMKTKPWKAAGDDGLPAGVWRQVWLAVSESVRQLFQRSLDTGVLPKQWSSKDHPAQEAQQGRLHLGESVETHLTAVDSGQVIRGGRCREDLVRGGN